MQYLLILGSNHQRAKSFRLAAKQLAARFAVLAHSRAMPTRDARSKARYLNAAVVIESSAARDALRAQLREVEAAAGRDRSAPVCALDIDLVARLENGKVIEVIKPDDLAAPYAAPLLAALGIAK
ncbi:hypothetical protein CO608_09720 [Lysobacteraceae bacterium NML08-0793]|nr:hypothetical protein CO608_09720 [Xanthomonadaceae bacterium NML08-0793]